MTQTSDLTDILTQAKQFSSRFDSVIMATVNHHNEPEASYAPYLEQNGQYYVYISALASHTRSLQYNPQCQLLFIEDEATSKNLFARQRLTLSCHAIEIQRDTLAFETILNALEEKFGNMMRLLRTLNDFQLFQLTPKTGSYVLGFGKAYELTGEQFNQITHVSADVLKQRI